MKKVKNPMLFLFSLFIVFSSLSQAHIKFKERTYIKKDTMAYERVQKKKKDEKVIFSEYYKNNVPVSTWTRHNELGDSLIYFDFSFDLIYVESIPENILIFDLDEEDGEKSNIKPPKYFGGRERLISEIYNNLIYPLFAARIGLQGTVEVLYEIKKNGIGIPIGVVKGIAPELDKEAMRVLRGLETWNPAEVDGTPTDSYTIFPLNFTLSE